MQRREFIKTAFMAAAVSVLPKMSHTTQQAGGKMSKKIVILNGSPRLNGNTKGLIEAFTKGAESQGHNVKCLTCRQ